MAQLVTGTLATPGVLANLDPIQNAQWWDVVTIAGTTSPGVCEVGAFDRAYSWEVRAGKGADGGTVTFVQKPPAKGSLKFLLWTVQHFADWATFYPLFKYDPAKTAIKVTAVDIYHPALAAIEVFAVVVEKISSPVHRGNQVYEISVDLLEYRPPSPVSAVYTPNKSLLDNPDAPVADPFKDADAQLQEQNAGLANQLAGP